MKTRTFIKSIGGATLLAQKLGVRRDAIYQWCRIDTVPYKWRPALAMLAKKAKVNAPSEIVNFLAAK